MCVLSTSEWNHSASAFWHLPSAPALTPTTTTTPSTFSCFSGSPSRREQPSRHSTGPSTTSTAAGAHGRQHLLGHAAVGAGATTAADGLGAALGTRPSTLPQTEQQDLEDAWRADFEGLDSQNIDEYAGHVRKHARVAHGAVKVQTTFEVARAQYGLSWESIRRLALYGFDPQDMPPFAERRQKLFTRAEASAALSTPPRASETQNGLHDVNTSTSTVLPREGARDNQGQMGNYTDYTATYNATHNTSTPPPTPPRAAHVGDPTSGTSCTTLSPVVPPHALQAAPPIEVPNAAYNDRDDSQCHPDYGPPPLAEDYAEPANFGPDAAWRHGSMSARRSLESSYNADADADAETMPPLVSILEGANEAQEIQEEYDGVLTSPGTVPEEGTNTNTLTPQVDDGKVRHFAAPARACILRDVHTRTGTV